MTHCTLCTDMYVTFYRGNKLEKKSYYIYQKSLYYPTVQRMKCRSVVLGYLGTQDQSYFISMLPAGRTAKSTGTADDDQFNWTTHTAFPHKVQRADLTCDVIRKVAPFVLSKL